MINILLIVLGAGESKTEIPVVDKRWRNTAEDMVGDNVHESEESGARANQGSQGSLYNSPGITSLSWDNSFTLS